MLNRPWQGSLYDALWGTPRAETAAPSRPRPLNDQNMGRGQRGSLQKAEKQPVTGHSSRIRTHFWALLGPLEKCRRDGVRDRAPFVAILSVRSDPWHYKRVIKSIARSKLSDTSFYDLKVISRELARSGHHLAAWRADQGAAERFRLYLWHRKRAPSACTPRVLRTTL